MTKTHTVTVSGKEYHEKKRKFHALLKKYSFRWKGKDFNYRWYSIGQTVTAVFDRDNDITINAKIVWMGTSETSFLDELKELFK